MKEEISNSFRKAGIYSIQIDSTKDITSTDNYSNILRFVRETSKNDFLPLLTILCNLLKEVLQKQSIDISKCISDSTDEASDMLRQYNGYTAFLEKESPGHIQT